ncbi:MarR family transcriptional regulator [uncultured Ferrimonas sp.]|uniref:MarR family winged helix-turn-helix transcriptional regulator n=1 Tax=uncultured Ferrimonas sp. TaxID=432640 RepID=UPI00260FA447|nr:MarR family transcriptional regulator [uncultured Ferrimonas sp.]
MNQQSNGELFTTIVLEMFKVGGMLNAQGDDMAEEFGMSSARWKVLGAIAKAQTALTVAQIARTMGQSRQATQRIADVMVKDGLLQWQDNPNHKRAKLTMLTPEGEKIYQQLDLKQSHWADSAAEKISREQLEHTYATLQLMAKHFES